MKAPEILAVALSLVACASTDFQPYEGRAGTNVVEGVGGTKSVLDGYDIWDNGNPPRRYKRLGVVAIEDFDNVFGNQRIRQALVEAIKAAEGDAAVVVDKSGGGRMIGTAVSSTGAVSTAVGFGKKEQRYEIVKYLD